MLHFSKIKFSLPFLAALTLFSFSPDIHAQVAMSSLESGLKFNSAECTSIGGKCEMPLIGFSEYATCSEEVATPVGKCIDLVAENIRMNSQACCKVVLPAVGGDASDAVLDDTQGFATFYRQWRAGEFQGKTADGGVTIAPSLPAAEREARDAPANKIQAEAIAEQKAAAGNPSFNYTLLEKIPGVDGANLNLAAYLSAVYKLAIWIVGLCALFMFLIGAFMYMLSAANTSKMGSAKEIMQDALIGLVLALTSYLILYVINPDLVNLKLPTVSMPSTSSTPSGGAPTSVTPPAGTYSHTEAVQALSSKGISTSSSGNCNDQNNKTCTSLNGIPKATIEDVIRLKEGTGCPVTVTGGTEVGHKSHGTGLPVVDLSENTCLEQYFSQNKPVGYDVTKICADGTSQAASYNCGSYVEAQAHFHIQFNT